MIKNPWKSILFGAAILFLFFFWIHKIPLWSSDEGRFGEKAREILVFNDFIVPHFNYVVSIEKPILAYAVTALCYIAGGVNSLTTRLPSVLSALLGILLCYGFSRRLFNQKTADWAALLLATSIGYVLVGRFAVIDMLMTLFLSGALFCLMTACLEGQRKYYFFAYAFMGLAFLAKGLIGILLPILVFFVFLIWTKKISEITKMRLGWGIAIIALIILPWCIAISIRQPEFFDVFIVQNHFSRFATPTFGRKRPFWFFLPILIALSFPWSFFLPAAVASAARREARERLKFQFLISWLAVIFIFFSIPKSKLPYYLLPLVMPLAVLVAAFFAGEGIAGRRKKDRTDRLTRIAWNGIPLICLLGLAGLQIYLFLPLPKRPEILALAPILHVSSIVLLAGSLSAYFLYKKDRPKPALAALAGMVYLGLVLTIIGMNRISPFQSTFLFAETLKPKLVESDIVAVFSSPDHFSDLPFHLQRRVMVVGTDWGEFRKLERDPRYAADIQKWFVDSFLFVHFFNTKKERIFCLTDEEDLPELTSVGLRDYYIVQKGYGRVLISNTQSV